MKNWSALKSKYKDLGGGDDRYKYRMKSCVLTCQIIERNADEFRTQKNEPIKQGFHDDDTDDTS